MLEGDEARTTPPETRRRDIQGMRALAVLLVVAFHAGLSVPGGFTGVDVFFTISGFVITGMLIRERSRTGRISFSGFYSRRARRILPALALTISVGSILSFLGVSPLGPKTVAARTGIAAMFSVANVYLYRTPGGYFSPDQTTNPFLHTWSLSVEEQFYLVFPALLVLAWWCGRRIAPKASRLATGTIAIATATLGSFALSVITTNPVPASAARGNSSFAFYMAPTRAWEFGAGALLALALPLLRRIPRGAAITLGWIGLVVVGIGTFAISEATPFPGTAALLPVVGTCLLLAAGAAGTAGVSAALSHRSLIYLGNRSYSWYLWHWPIIVFAHAVWPHGGDRVAMIAAIVSFGPAWLAYRFVENPLRRNDRVTGGRALVVAVTCIAVASVTCVALERVVLPGRSVETAAFLAALDRQGSDGSHGCASGRSIAHQPPSCTWHVANSRGTIVLVGDSNAGQFAEPAARAANRLGYDFLVGTRRGCGFSEVLVGIKNPKSPCLRYVRQSIRDLVAQKPAMALMASSVPELVESKDAFRDPDTGAIGISLNTKAQMWEVGVRKAVQPLVDAGVPTVVVHTIPQFQDWQRDCAAIRAYLDPASCGTAEPRAVAETFRRRSVQAEERAVRGLPLASTVDFADRICTPSVCRTNRRDRWLYKDGLHLSFSGALGLVDDFAHLIATHVRPPNTAS